MQTDGGYKKAIEYWSLSDQIERYKKPVVSREFRIGFVWMMIGAFCGFAWGLIIASIIF